MLPDMKTLLENSCGEDNIGNPRSTVNVTLSHLVPNEDGTGIDKIIDDTTDCLNCIVDIQPLGSLVNMTLKFHSHLDTDLRFVWDSLQKYGEAVMQESDDEDSIHPLLEVTIFPMHFNGDVYMSAINPTFKVLTSENPEEQYNKIISMAFDATDNFFVFEPEDFDISEHIANAEREGQRILEQQEMDEIAAMKAEAERNAYYDDDYESDLSNDDSYLNQDDSEHKSKFRHI